MRSKAHYLSARKARFVEEVPRWWEAEDTIPMDRVPNGPSLTIALLPTLSLDAWRKNAWPDRPHP